MCDNIRLIECIHGSLTQEQGKALVSQANVHHKGDLEFWQNKCSRSETKMAQKREDHQMALAKLVEKQQQHEVSLSFSFFSFVSMHAVAHVFIFSLLCSLLQKHSTKEKWNY